MSSTRIAMLALLAGCAHGPRIPPLAAVEEEAPIRWPLRPLTPLPERVDVGPLSLELSASKITARADGLEVAYLGEAAKKSGTGLDRGFARRYAFIAPDRFERYVEVFRGSPILSIFPRIHQGALPTHSFEIPGHLDQVVSFDHERPIVGPHRKVILDPRHTTQPVVIVRSSDDREGVLFFFPHRPELRRWYVEDYVVVRTVDAIVETASASVRVRFPELNVPASPRMSFDFPIYVMPYRGAATSAIEHFRIGDAVDYWEPRPGDDVPLQYRQGGLRMLRYHPAEFASWIDMSGHAYGHPGGFGWGNMTMSMKGMLTDPLSERALLRDQAFRVLTFFVEAGREKGAPPNLNMHPQWTNEMEDPNDIRTIVFCQYWEFRLREFEKLFDSPHLSDAEKHAIYDDLQAARRVFDPEHGGFVSRTPNGGVWFDYLDLPIHPEPGFIINTHTTNLINVGHFVRLAKKMGRDADREWWHRLFLLGLDGQDYALAQDWMWSPEDPNELRYSKNSDGPQSYHFYMLLAWVPDLVRLAKELAPDRVPGLLALMKRLMAAKFLARDRSTMARAQALLLDLTR